MTSRIFHNVYSKSRFPLKSLRELVTYVQYGISAPATETKVGYPILRMNNLQNDGWELSNLKYIELTENEIETYRLQNGDILFNRTNSKELVGKCEVFKEKGDWVFASYLVRVRIDESIALPDFVSIFLNTPSGRVQIDRVSRQIIGMANINAEEIRDLVIPIAPLDRQQVLVAEIQAAQKSREQKLKEADTLLSGIDEFLLDQLGIVQPQEERFVYAITLKEASYANRFSADYFHPERTLAIKSIRSSKHGSRVKRLKDIMNFQRDIEIVSNSEEYIGLANVQSNTGELIKFFADEAKGQCFRFYTGDILFARLRPYLNKVHRAEHSGVCSTEFHVIRVQNVRNQEDSILPDYLALVLRSSVVVAQTKHMMTGNTHPRLANDDVVDLLIPIPSLDHQEKIVEELSGRCIKARHLHEEAATEWEAAKVRFEKQLLSREVS